MERDGDGYGRVDANWEVAQIQIVFVLPARLGGRLEAWQGCLLGMHKC